MTIISLVRSNKRGKTSRKRSLWLPIIAPKGKTSSSGVNPAVPVKTSIPRSHERFPPRSRKGCWTCRSRKVKCDEKHPRCNQCTRLGHDCDYRPRLSFRDDTRRVIERMSDVETVGNLVWDPHMSRSARLPSADYGLPDLLPSFATLTTDEERERKAQSSIPGTYNVIIMPESFSYLPGHADERSGEQCRSSTPSSLIDSGLSSHNPEVNDPNVVILKTFPDARRYLCSDYRGYTQTPGSDPRDFPYPSTVSVYSADSSTLDDYNAQAQTKLIDYEAMLLSHFRNVVWPKLVPQGICSDGHRLGVEVLEQEAAICPPLFQAMMALSKLGLERQGSCVGMGAMNPPRQDFPLPQDIFHHSDNLLSDGLFLTQFLLLIHEAMAAKSDGPSLWSHHISRMLEITFLRQSAFGVERFPFVIWWICNIDLYALLSGAGTGAYVKTVLESDLLPWPGSLLSPIGPHGSDVIYSHEPDNLTLLLQLYMDMFGLAVQLGLTIADMKKLGASYPYSPINLHEDFRRLWDSSDVRFWAENQTRLPKQLQNIFEQINLLFHTSLLLYYTSMCPSQSIGLGEIPAQIVHHHTTMIFQHAEAMMVRIQGSPPHFIIFPLFLAGIAAETIDLKVKAWELLSNLEENEIGYNASTTCSMLQLVYEYQMQRSSGNSSSRAFPWIDWVELLAERGFRLVSYG